MEEEANASTSPGTSAIVEQVPTGPKTTPGGGAPQDDVVNTVGGLVGEATAVLRSLHRAKIMAMQCKSVGASLCDGGEPDVKVGLLDGGATHPLRTGLPNELAKAELVPVDLAHGRVSLKQDPVTGTILVEGGIEPIVPVRGLIDLAYKLQWSPSGCVVVHPKRGKSSSWLRDGCPVVAEEAEHKQVEDLNDEENLGEDIMSGGQNASHRCLPAECFDTCRRTRSQQQVHCLGIAVRDVDYNSGRRSCYTSMRGRRRRTGKG